MFYVLCLYDGAPDWERKFSTMDEAMTFIRELKHDTEEYWVQYDILTEDEYRELMDTL